jgi:hypothetical protein
MTAALQGQTSSLKSPESRNPTLEAIMADGKIPITDAKHIATERRLPVVIVFGIEQGGERFSVASYGMTRKLCKVGVALADQFADAIMTGKVRTPSEEPHDEMDKLTELFYDVRGQRNSLLWACEKALAAYDAAHVNSSSATWSGADVDKMREAVATVKNYKPLVSLAGD